MDEQLATLLSRASPRESVRLRAGEFAGPQYITRPIHLTGQGGATVIWARSGPVLRLSAPEIQLSHLSVEVTDEQDGMAIVLEGEALRHPPRFVDVQLIGRVVDHEGHLVWALPAIIDLGRVAPTQSVQHAFEVWTPASPTLRARLVGLQTTLLTLRDQRHEVKMLFDAPSHQADTLIDGELEVEAGGLRGTIRIVGEIVVNDDHDPLAAAALPVAPHEIINSASSNVFAGGARQASAHQRSKATTVPEPATTYETSLMATKAAEALAAGNFAEAERLSGEVLSRNPQHVPSLAVQAHVASRLNELTRARDLWERLIGLAPDLAGLPGQLARCYNQLGQYKATVVLLEQSLQTPAHQQDQELLRALATAYYHLNRRHEALWALDRALELQPDPKLQALRRAWERQQP